MADIFQTGALATLHRLGPTDVSRLERELEGFAKERPIALVLPCHVNELGTDALERIIRELSEVRYLRQIVVGIDGARTSAEWQKARAAFASMPQNPALLWNDGPRMKAMFEKFNAAHLSGKGRNVWVCLGYVLASGQARIVATHDCDVTTYSRELLARLYYPVANKALGFQFCKGFIARYSTRLNGRVMRLLLAPLIRSLQGIVGAHPFLTYLAAFRYPLSGEMCLDVSLARTLRVPSDWGVEVGVLAGVFRSAAPQTVCQSELAERYDHKHHELAALHPMAVDVSKALFRVMAAEGIALDAAMLERLQSDYSQNAGDTLGHYHADAQINGLDYDRREEESAVAVFANAVRIAANAFTENPSGASPIPAWEEIESTQPGLLAELEAAVRADNAAT